MLEIEEFDMAEKKKEKDKKLNDKGQKNECKKENINIQNSLDQLGTLEMTRENKVNPGAVAENNTTEAEKVNMNGNLVDVAQEITKLLENMGNQLRKEDKQRKKLITFFEKFTCAITLGPIIVIFIVYFISKGDVGIGTQLAALAAFINIPISSIGVLKCIASSLFNDTYRKTMPDMITNVIGALTDYDVVYSERNQQKTGKKNREQSVHR